MSKSESIDIDHLYQLDLSDEDDAIDYLFNTIDDALFEGHENQSWPDIEEFIKRFDIERASSILIVAVLSITLPVRNKLKGRKELVDSIRIKFSKEMGPVRTRGLLSGLE